MRTSVRPRWRAFSAACIWLLALTPRVGAEPAYTTWPAAYRWHTYFGSTEPDYGGALAVDGAGRVTLVGTSYVAWNGPAGQPPLRPATPGDAAGVVVQVDAAGAYRWHAFYPCELAAISVDAADNVYLAGACGKSWDGPAGQPPRHAHPGGANAIAVVKLDRDGGYLWHTFYGNGHPNYNNGAAGVAGEVWVTGFSDGGAWAGPAGQSPLNPYTGLSDAFVLKLDADGGYEWHAFFGSGSDSGTAVAVDANGDAVVAGRSGAAWNGPGGRAPLAPYRGTVSNRYVAFILKLRATGQYLWHTFHGAGADVPNDVAVSASGIHVAGRSGMAWNGPAGQPPLNGYRGTVAGPYDMLVLALDADGAYRWHTYYGTGADNARGIACDGITVYVTGSSGLTWSGPAGQPPAHPIAGYSGVPLLALGTDGAYRGHDFIGTNASATGIAARHGAVVIGGDGAGADGPDGQPPLHAYAGYGDLFALKVTPASPAFVLSDEGTHLIGAMVQAGHGGLGLYDALTWMAANAVPAIGGTLTQAFLGAVATCPASTPARATRLDAVPPGSAVAIAADCSAPAVSISGARVFGSTGTATAASTLPGVGRFELTAASQPGALPSWQANGTTYHAFAAAWSVRLGALRRALPGSPP